MVPARAPAVLIVEDDAVASRHLAALVAKNFPRARVEVASDADEAVSRLASKPDFDLLVADVDLGPGADGISFLARARDLAPRAVRAVVTGSEEYATAQRALNEGRAHAYFTKPVDAAKFTTLIGRLLEERQISDAHALAFARARELTRRGPRRILIVDDAREIAHLYARFAERLPPGTIHVQTETDPTRARELVVQGDYDVVLTDYRMPSVNGIDLLITARSASPEARRILITGYNELPEAKERLESAQPDAIVRKPFAAQDALLLLRDAVSDDPSAMDDHRARVRALTERSEGTRIPLDEG